MAPDVLFSLFVADVELLGGSFTLGIRITVRVDLVTAQYNMNWRNLPSTDACGPGCARTCFAGHNSGGCGEEAAGSERARGLDKSRTEHDCDLRLGCNWVDRKRLI